MCRVNQTCIPNRIKKQNFDELFHVRTKYDKKPRNKAFGTIMARFGASNGVYNIQLMILIDYG